MESLVAARTTASTALDAHNALRLGRAESDISYGLSHLFALSENYPDLKADKLFSLSLWDSPVTDEQLAAASRLQTLTEFGFNDCPKLTADSFEVAAALRRLDGFYVHYCKEIGDAAISHLDGHPKLRRFGIAGLPMTDAALERPLNLPSLNWFSVEDTAITADGLRAFASGTLPKLKRLLLGRRELQSGCLDAVESWTTLEELTLTAGTLSSEHFDSLKRLTHLHRLKLLAVELTAAQREQLQRALPDCTIECLSR